MGFVIKALTCVFVLASSALTALLPTEIVPFTKRDDGCVGGGYVVNPVIGSRDGDPFCEARFGTTGEVISELEVWSSKKGITGVSVTYSSGKSVMHGDQGSDEPQTMTLEAGELVSSARLWGNGRGQHLGHIYIKTNKQEFEAGMKKPNDGFEVNVGGGLLVGAKGATGEDYIENLGLIFLEAKIEKVKIGDVKYDEDPTGTSINIAPVYLIRSTFGNPAGSTGNVTFSVTGSNEVTQSTTWEQSSMTRFGASLSVEVEAEPFGIGTKTTGSVEWSHENTNSNGGSKSAKGTISTTAGPMSLQRGQGKSCKILAQKGEGDFPYASTVRMTLEGGREISFEEKGLLKSVQYSEATASCADANNSTQWSGTPANPPKGVTILNKGE